MYTGKSIHHMSQKVPIEFKRQRKIERNSRCRHVPSKELPEVIGKVIKALKNSGIFYLSFKYGHFEGYRNDRYFTDYKEDTFAQLMAPFHELTVVDHWISTDARPGRSDEKWLNEIMVKIGE